MNKPVTYPKLSVLICTVNEEQNLPNILPKIPDWVNEIVLVDGHSTDDTIEIARRLRPGIIIISQPSKGKGDALRSGIAAASGDIVITLDADDATDPGVIANFVDPLLVGYDYVKGTRFVNGKTYNKLWYRIMGNWIITLTFDILFFRPYTDVCSGYNAFWRERIIKLTLFSADGYENEPLINARIVKAGLRVKEVGHIDKGRSQGESKEISWRQGIKAVKSIIRERFNDLP
jgi:glycosyltransferase involved in cell wall biosynthesis